MVSYFIWPTEEFTRLCLPADYTTDKLYHWNQKQSKNSGNPWKLISWWKNIVGQIAHTRINEGTAVYLHNPGDYPILKTNIDPKHPGFNWSHDKANHKFSYEFYLDNDLEETASTLIYDDDESFWSVVTGGSGTIDLSIQEETTTVKKGTSSLKMEIISGSAGVVGVSHDFTPSKDWSSYEFICIWFYGSNSGQTVDLQLRTPDINNRGRFQFTDNFVGWQRKVFPLNNPTLTDGTFDLTNIANIRLVLLSPSFGQIFYLDRTVVDLGQWIKIEIFIPDELNRQGSGNRPNIEGYSWNGSDWSKCFWWMYQSGAKSMFRSEWCYTLDGQTFEDFYGAPWNVGGALYDTGKRGETLNVLSSGDGSAGNIVYSDYYGSKNRIGFAVKLPPDDFVDSSTFGISQCKFKFIFTYDLVEDTSGNGNHGVRYSGSTINAGPVSVDGKVGKGLEFDGIDDYVEINDSDSLDCQEAETIVMWVKPAVDLGSGTFYCFSDKSDGSYTHRLVWHKDSYLYFYSGVRINVRTSTRTLSANTWYHLAAISNFGTEDNHIYINGVEDSFDTGVGAYSPNTQNLRFGQSNSGADPFKGVIDEVLIYNRALTESEVRDCYNGNPPRNGLVGEWKFEFGNATYEFENSTNQYYGLQNIEGFSRRIQDTGTLKVYHGTFFPQNENPVLENGMHGGKALRFDGVNDYIKADNPITTQEFTMSFWVFVREFKTEGGLVNTGQGQAEGIMTAAELVGDNSLKGWIGDGTIWYTVAKTNLSLNKWYFFVLTYDGSVLKLYLDTNLEAQTEVLNRVLGSGLSAGRKAYAGFVYSNVSLDNLRIYNRALNKTEIEYLMNGNQIKDGLILEWKFDHVGKEPWICLFNPDKKFAKFLLLTGKPTLLEITADENERINKIKIDIPSGAFLYKEGIKYGEIFGDEDGDGVPDIFELHLPYLPSV